MHLVTDPIIEMFCQHYPTMEVIQTVFPHTLQIGHRFARLAHFLQAAVWPHGANCALAGSSHTKHSTER